MMAAKVAIPRNKKALLSKGFLLISVYKN